MMTVCNKSKRLQYNKRNKNEGSDENLNKKSKFIDDDESNDDSQIPNFVQINQYKERKCSNKKKNLSERKMRIPFLESSDSDSEKSHNKKESRYLIDKEEENLSYYHLSDYRIPNENAFNDSLKPLNLKIIENPSHPKFNEELADSEIRLFPNQYKKFFEIVTDHLRTKFNDNKLLMKLLIAIDSVLYYDQAIDSLIKSGLVDSLPFTTPKLIILSYKIIKLLFMFRPIQFQENFLETMKHFLYIFPVEMSLSLLIIYSHSFEYIENPWPILDLLIKNKEKFFKQDSIDQKDIQKIRKYYKADPGFEADFFIDDIDFNYLSLLLFLNTNFPIYRKNRLKNCRKIFIDSLFDPIISKKASQTGYKAVITLYDSEFGEQIDISNLFRDLKEKDFEELAIQLLYKMNVDLIPIKEKYIFQLINSSHANEKASLILLKMMSNSQRNAKIASILLSNSKWLKFGLPTFSYTSMILQSCIKFGNYDMTNCEELPFFFTALLQSNDINDIKSIPVIIHDIHFDDFQSLSQNEFFSLLYDIISTGEDQIVLPYIDLLSNLANLQYSPEYKKYIKVLKKFLKKDENIFHASLKAIAKLSDYDKCAVLIQNQNIVSVAEKNCQSKSEIKLLHKIKRNLNEL